LKRSRAKFKKLSLIRGCPTAAITPAYFYTHIVHGVEDYWFTEIEIRGRGCGKKVKK